MSVDLIVAHVISVKKLIVEIDFNVPQRGKYIVAAMSVHPSATLSKKREKKPYSYPVYLLS